MQFDAVVHSVFASAVNLKPDDSPQLLTLLASAEADLPQGIRLEPSQALRFEGLRVGMGAACRHGLLRLDGDSLTVDLQQAACWDSSLPVLQARMDEAAAQAAWKQAWRALNERQADRASEMSARSLLSETPGEQPAWVQRAGRCMRLIVGATARREAAPIDVVEELIGLGPGLTPSGDDLVAGYLLGLRYAVRDKQERSGFIAKLAEAVLGILDCTGDISATYLFHAARGEPPRALYELTGAVCSGADETTVLACAQVAMSPGHTSGMDAVTGLLIGLAAWDAPGLLGIGDPGDEPPH